MADTVIGLEVTQDAVLAAEVRPARRRAVLHRHGRIELPANAAHDSEVVDSAVVTDAIRQLWKTARLPRRAKVVLGMDSWRVLVRDFSSPLTSLPRVLESLPFEVKDLLPVPVEQAAMDFVPTRIDDEGTHGLLVVAGAQSVDDLVRAVDAAGIRVDAVDLVGLALSRLAGEIAAPEETVAMIRIGRRTTVMSIAVDGVPQFVRMLPADIDLTAPALAAPGTRAERARSAHATNADLDDLAVRLRGTLDYYTGRSDSPSVHRVLVCGAATQHGSLIPALSDALRLPVERIEPTSFVNMRRHAIDPALAQDLVGTMALALGGAR